ncbi:RidA family protein [Rhizobium sp. YJ-22]|uniref:RidA family protein n=1 Tax=Rhizobium sp. YJ-22 TaxID=3037556 RepID=UPI002412BD21|nr:RidA family protein [Rhizobium sp. YJ-22]MDG3577841.1 RidA family protein [Rhizobium sp. YJ-22]
MADATPLFIPDDTDPEAISSDVAGLGNLLVTTQIPLRADGSLETGDITAQAECTLEWLKTALEKAGSGLDHVLHLTIYLTDMADRPGFNAVYTRYFKPPYPVRCAVGVSALADASMRVEVTAMAARKAVS